MLSLAFADMAGMFAGFGNFDGLINCAITECDIHFQSIPLLDVEKEREEAKILETLPEDFCYKFINISASGQKSSFSTEDITTENLDRWLTEFQPKKPTTGYFIQNYYSCQHMAACRRFFRLLHVAYLYGFQAACLPLRLLAGLLGCLPAPPAAYRTYRIVLSRKCLILLYSLSIAAAPARKVYCRFFNIVYVVYPSPPFDVTLALSLERLILGIIDISQLGILTWAEVSST